MSVSQEPDSGSGLGSQFAQALNANFGRLFSDDSLRITQGRHLEKLCLIRERVGRDNISDFTTNLVKAHLLSYTERFTLAHVPLQYRGKFNVNRVRFNYKTESWQAAEFVLPMFDSDFVLLVPRDLLTRDDTWINRGDLVKDFDSIPPAIPDAALRAQVDNYFRKMLPRKPKQKDVHEAARNTILEFPELIDYYIKLKEETGDRARSLSDEKVRDAEFLFHHNFARLVELLAQTGFYGLVGTSYEEAHERVAFLKQVIENNDGYRLFYDNKGGPIKREEDLQVAYRFTWFGSPFDVNREVNNGRGPVDYKISMSAADSTLVEFKLASNSQLKRNLQNQVAIYENANVTKKSIKVILYFGPSEKAKVEGILKELKLQGDRDVVLIDARRDNKPSASRA